MISKSSVAMLSHLLSALVEYRCREFVAIFLLEEVALFLMFFKIR